MDDQEVTSVKQTISNDEWNDLFLLGFKPLLIDKDILAISADSGIVELEALTEKGQKILSNLDALRERVVGDKASQEAAREGVSATKIATMAKILAALDITEEEFKLIW